MDQTPAYALVVAVETYVSGATELDGPVRDACKFVAWLRAARNFPPQNIHFHASPKTANVKLLEELRQDHEVSWQPAARESVINTITGELTDRDLKPGVLFVFWTGHGILTANDEHRKLLFGDYRSDDMRMLDFQALRLYLQTRTFSKFEKQIFLVDACACSYDPLYQGQLPAGNPFTIGEKDEQISQYAIFATLDNRDAVNLEREQTGLFFKELLPLLESESEWPPKMDAVFDRLKKRFQQLRDEGRYDQLPAKLIHKPFGMPESAIEMGGSGAISKFSVAQPSAFRLALDRFLPGVHRALCRWGWFGMSMPPEYDTFVKHCNVLHDKMKARNKFYLALEAADVDKTEIERNITVPDFQRIAVTYQVRQLIRKLISLTRGGTRVDAQLAGFDSRSRIVRNVLAEILKADYPVILLGNPGTGKSMTLRQVALNVCRFGRARVYPMIAVYARLGELHVDGELTEQDIWRFVIRHLDSEMCHWFSSLKASGRLVVLFDGMDEMSREKYSQYVQELSKFASKYRGQVRTLFSCRINDFDPVFVHKQLALLPFDKAQIEEYLEHVMRFPAVIGGEPFSASELAARLSDDGLPLQTDNPLNLYLLKIFLISQKAWPASRAAIFEFFFRQAYNSRIDESERIGKRLPTRSLAFLAWGKLAFAISLRNQGSLMPIEAARQAIKLSFLLFRQRSCSAGDINDLNRGGIPELLRQAFVNRELPLPARDLAVVETIAKSSQWKIRGAEHEHPPYLVQFEGEVLSVYLPFAEHAVFDPEELISAGVRCGVLVREERPEGLCIRFEHHRFQEYFAARHINEHEASLDIQHWPQYLDSPRWQETLVNLVTLGGGDTALKVLANEIARDLNSLGWPDPLAAGLRKKVANLLTIWRRNSDEIDKILSEIERRTTEDPELLRILEIRIESIVGTPDEDEMGLVELLLNTRPPKLEGSLKEMVVTPPESPSARGDEPDPGVREDAVDQSADETNDPDSDEDAEEESDESAVDQPSSEQLAERAELERKLADRVKLGSQIMSEAGSANELVKSRLGPCLEPAMKKLANYGNPSSQVKMLRACKNLPVDDLMAILAKPLSSNTDWVKEHALIVLATGRADPQSLGSDLATEIGYELAKGTFLSRHKIYQKVVKSAGSRDARRALYAAWVSSAVQLILLLFVPLIGIWLAFNTPRVDSLNWSPIEETLGVKWAFLGLYGVIVFLAIWLGVRKSTSATWIACGTGCSIGLAVMFVVQGIAEENLERAFYHIIASTYVLITVSYAFGLVGSLASILIYLTSTKSQRIVTANTGNMIQVVWNRGYFPSAAPVLGVATAFALLLIVFVLFIHPLALSLGSLLGEWTNSPLSPLLNLAVAGALIYLAFLVARWLIMREFKDSADYIEELITFAILAVVYFVFIGVGAYFQQFFGLFDRFWVWVGKIIGIALVTILVVVVLAMTYRILVRDWLSRLWRRYRTNPQILPMSREEWVRRIKQSSPFEQAALFTPLPHARLGIDKDEMFNVLLEIADDIRDDPAKSKYWSYRHELDESRRQDRSPA